jgi:hypothetical protein
MTEDVQGRRRGRKRVWLALAAVVAILAVLILPPLVSVSRYKSSITRLMSASLGRPVRLSSVELRLLPWPAFLLTDLTVEEDPAYGAEPVLHAGTVTASIRLLSLWRGKLEIAKISVDDASLNLVRTGMGQWNLNPLFVTATGNAGADRAGQDTTGQNKIGRGRAVPLPYLEATNLRINLKSGAEKLPFSLVDTDLSFWQEDAGDWRIRLRGQPARTDVSLDLADTGVVRLEASVRRASGLRQMPVHLDMEWREAQLGQLTRLIIGSDPGWRGDLMGELHLDGTAETAQIKTRLRATGVHRAEFAPVAPMDFDARCGFVYHFTERAVEGLLCDSPLGDGRIRLTGDLPGEAGLPRLTVEVDQIPVAAGLDALRTVRSGIGPGLEARGTIRGKIVYAPGDAVADAAPGKQAGRASLVKSKAGKTRTTQPRAPQGPLTGSLIVEGFQLSGDGLRTPIQIPKVVLTPAAPSTVQQAGQQSEPYHSAALVAAVAIPAGAPIPLAVTTRLALSGYQVTVHGQAALARARELAKIGGMADGRLDALAGDAVTVDLSAEGPWLAAEGALLSSAALNRTGSRIGSQAGTGVAPLDETPDRLSGTVTLHNANWKADYLSNQVQISQATLHLDMGGDGGETRWDPVVFSYGPVKGTASLTLPGRCDALQRCPPHFQVQFGALDAAALQAAILGAQEQGTLLSELIARLSPAKPSPVWPELEGTVTADSLVLGPVTLEKPSAALKIDEGGVEIADLDAGLLGGSMHGAGTLHAAGAGQSKPGYTLEAKFEKLSPPALGQLLGQRMLGGFINADGKLELVGFTDADLASSAKGTLHFEWRHGAVAAEAGRQAPPAVAVSGTRPAPAALGRFDKWSGDAEIGGGTITIRQSEVVLAGRSRAVDAAVTLGDPPKVSFSQPRETRAKR